jgi:hypothetical protein
VAWPLQPLPGVLRSLVFTLTLVAWAGPAAAEGALDEAEPRLDVAALFGRIEARVQALVARGESPLLIFDIDDTLRLVKTRAAVAGAVAFVHRMKRAGARIVYLSHRPGVDEEGNDTTPRTRGQLERLGFPVQDETILLNPEPKLTSSEWKGRAVVQHLPPGVPVAHFENDKPVVRTLRRAFGRRVEVIRMASLLDCTSEADPTPALGKGGIRVIRDFRYGVTWAERLRSTRWVRAIAPYRTPKMPTPRSP